VKSTAFSRKSETNFFGQLNDQVASSAYTANSGFKYHLDYTDGSGITLTVDAVPEPSSFGAILGASLLGLRRRRRA
jgi:hypothetical protein